jgi:hypothetical protein
MQRYPIQKPASLKDDGDRKSEWAKLLRFLGDVVLWGGGVLLVGLIPVWPTIMGVYWVICLIPGLEFSDGPFANSVAIVFAVALTGSFSLRILFGRLDKEKDYWRYQWELKNREADDQRRCVRRLSYRLGLPLDDGENED